ncbi:type II toxin-antitoxin system Phd/YefM family antitoxin [Actinotalea sp. C106]|uniref:type II toxin-antitoxin system Phd/YefM family antitoxin n=1 Tax=Actinotalea sp. C106 TaxID=2908644 RepID=UPI002028A30B|nr:type II toxin-antitoxin system Phd/YefM family antitoxin [Actinotalea sp. C106]
MEQDRAAATTVTFPSAGGGVTLHSAGDPHPTALPPALVADLFTFGLRLPEPVRTSRPSVVELAVDDAISFAVGATEVSTEAALQALRRGLEQALQRAVRQAHPHRSEDPTVMNPPPATSPPQRTATVTIHELQERFDELLEAVERDNLRLIITRDGTPAAVLLPWEYYDRLASHEG